MMTVGELKELLKFLHNDTMVLLSGDGEGTFFSGLAKTYFCGAYKNGNIGLKELTEEYVKMGYTEENVIKDGTEVLLLYPVERRMGT